MIELLNGNSIELMKEIPTDNICIVSDPPFNVGYKYNKYNDNKPKTEYLEMLYNIFLKGEKPLVVIAYSEILYDLAIKFGKAPTRVVSWVYNSNTARQHRDIAFWNIKPDFSAVRQPYKNPNDKRIKERIARGCLGAKLYDWWNINQVKNVSKKRINHPCVMPEEVMDNIIGILPKDLIIVDPFMGSGSTGVACKKAHRDFIGIDMDSSYVELAKTRISEVGEK